MDDIKFWTGFLFVGDYCLLLKSVGSIVFPAAAVGPIPVLTLLIFHVSTGIRFYKNGKLPPISSSLWFFIYKFGVYALS